MATSGPAVFARFPGDCPRCETPITVGEQIQWSADWDNQYVHTGCKPDAVDQRRKPCPSCHLVHAGGCF